MKSNKRKQAQITGLHEMYLAVGGGKDNTFHVLVSECVFHSLNDLMLLRSDNLTFWK